MPGPALSPRTPISNLQRQFEHWLFDLPAEVGGRPLHLLLGPCRYLYALLRDFVRGDLGLRAMASSIPRCLRSSPWWPSRSPC